MKGRAPCDHLLILPRAELLELGSILLQLAFSLRLGQFSTSHRSRELCLERCLCVLEGRLNQVPGSLFSHQECSGGPGQHPAVLTHISPTQQGEISPLKCAFGLAAASEVPQCVQLPTAPRFSKPTAELPSRAGALGLCQGTEGAPEPSVFPHGRTGGLLCDGPCSSPTPATTAIVLLVLLEPPPPASIWRRSCLAALMV